MDTDTQIHPLMRLGQRRDALLERIVEELKADPRVDAVWLSGSFGRGEEDAWSDLDIHVTVDDASVPGFLDERPSLYEAVAQPILVQRDKASNSMPGGSFQLVVYPGPVEVDWNIGPTGQAQRHERSRVLFDRVGIPIWSSPPLTVDERRSRAEASVVFFWAMAPIAVKYAGRGNTRRAAAQIDLLTGAAVSLIWLAEESETHDPTVPYSNHGLESGLYQRLPRLGWTIDPAAALNIIQQLCDVVACLHPKLVSLGVPVPAEMPGEATRLGEIAERAIQAALEGGD